MESAGVRCLAIGIVGAVPSLQNELLDGLAAAGSRGHAQDDNTANGSLDALVDLTPMRADWSADDVPALFGRVRHALVSGASHVLVAGMAPAVNGAPPTGALAPPAAGVSGMIKSLSKEWPDRQVRFAYFLPRFGANELARTILDELNSADDADVVEYSREGERRVPRVVAAERNGGDGAGVALGVNNCASSRRTLSTPIPIWRRRRTNGIPWLTTRCRQCAPTLS